MARRRFRLNEHLRHEFSDRVSQQRKVVLCRLLSEALKHFKVTVTAAEAQEEKQLVASDAVVASKPMLSEVITRDLEALRDQLVLLREQVRAETRAALKSQTPAAEPAAPAAGEPRVRR